MNAHRMGNDALRGTVLKALYDVPSVGNVGAATDAVLAALGLDDLDAFVVRVADDLYGVHSDAYRRGLVARALEAALTATGEGEAS